MARRSIYLDSFGHRNPIPVAAQIGPFLRTGVLTGRDPATGEMPDSLAAQCDAVFARIRDVLAAADATPDDVLKVTVRLSDATDRDDLNRCWLELYPDAENRPARQVIASTLGGGARIHVDFEAVLEPVSQ
ncbi:RidA family protein [Gulosibacter faecalis]|uniref:RidA family protein n=1 Tax=Gulosibacter faecalis TaxID=272240 RepID=A0ABW5V354_9MICO|nr:RidA family protein [Gulosibacter faecalis]